MMKTLELINKLKSDAKRDYGRFQKDPYNQRLFNNDKLKKPDEYHDQTFLYIRATDNDNGSRPLPQGTIKYHSPDIELYDNNNNLIPTNQLTANVPHTVAVQVNNDGDLACNSCIVELFICNPSLGFNRASAEMIGMATVFIAPHDKTIHNFSFVPEVEHIGHRCLFARAYSYASGDLPESPNSFSATDRHIGQQNLNVIQQGNDFKFQICPDKRKKTQKLKITLTQIKQPVQNFKLQELKPLNTVENNLQLSKFNISKKVQPIIKNELKVAPRKIMFKEENLVSSKSFIAKLIQFILKLFKIGADDKNQIILSKSKNTWKDQFDAGVHEMKLEIPNMNLKKDQACPILIELTDEESNEEIGGILLVVKG